MPWAKLDDMFPDHPKIGQVGPLAGWLFVCGICYASRYLTDGFLPKTIIRRLADIDDPQPLVERLVAARLWEEVQDGYQIHDYLKYNPPAEQVRREREDNARRQNRWRESHKAIAGSNAVSNAVTNEASNAVSTVVPYPSRTHPVPGSIDPVPGDPVAEVGSADSSPEATAAPAPAETEATKKAEKPTKQKARTAKQIKKSTEEQLRAEYGDEAFDKAMEQAVLYTNEYSLPYCRKVLIRWAADFPGHPSPWTLKRATGPPGQPSPNGRQQQGVTRGIAQGNTRKAHDYSAYDDA